MKALRFPIDLKGVVQLATLSIYTITQTGEEVIECEKSLFCLLASWWD